MLGDVNFHNNLFDASGDEGMYNLMLHTVFIISFSLYSLLFQGSQLS